MADKLRPQVSRLGEDGEWIARVMDRDRLVYIEAGFSCRSEAASAARRVAFGLPAVRWEDCG